MPNGQTRAKATVVANNDGQQRPRGQPQRATMTMARADDADDDDESNVDRQRENKNPTTRTRSNAQRVHDENSARLRNKRTTRTTRQVHDAPRSWHDESTTRRAPCVQHSRFFFLPTMRTRHDKCTTGTWGSGSAWHDDNTAQDHYATSGRRVKTMTQRTHDATGTRRGHDVTSARRQHGTVGQGCIKRTTRRARPPPPAARTRRDTRTTRREHDDPMVQCR
jgi:hypothetical protein